MGAGGGGAGAAHLKEAEGWGMPLELNVVGVGVAGEVVAVLDKYVGMRFQSWVSWCFVYAALRRRDLSRTRR